MKISGFVVTLALAAISLSHGCESGEDDGGGQGIIQANTEIHNPELMPARKLSDVRDGYEIWRSLLREASRAELRLGGPLIDFGTPDQHKYTRGGWASGWQASEETNVSAARLSGGEGRLNAYLKSAPKELVVRARSPQGEQKLSIRIGNKAIGKIALTDQWQEQRLPLPELGTGRTTLKLRHESKKPVEVDWLWMAGEVGQKTPTLVERAGPVKIGKRLRRSLLAPGAQSYSFYLHVPQEATLLFDYAAKEPLDFIVRAESVDNTISELFRATSKERWQSANVDLKELAGQTVRLEFVTEGEGVGGAWGEPGLFIPPGEADAHEAIAKAKKAKNIVLVVMDTTRADQFETFTPGNGIHTPKLDAFSKVATSFTRAYNNGNWTKPSMLTMFSSLYPATHTATKPESMVPKGIELISEHLQKQGLKTQGFTSNPVVSAKFGFERGWDGFGVFYKNEARGEAMYKRASKWVKENGDEPFFLYVQTIDPHTTYAVPREYWQRYYKKSYHGPFGDTFTRADQKKIDDQVIKPSPDDVAWIQALYHGEITYQDEHVGYFLDQLKAQGRLEDTIVIVTNDHGEEIYDHGAFGHGWTLYEEMIRAPLMIHFPPLFPAATVVDDITEHVDIAPTVLEAMGLPPMKGTEGTSFLPALHGSHEQEPRYAIALSDNGKRSIHIGDWKLEVSEGKGWTRLLHMPSEGAQKEDRRRDAELAGRLCEIYMGEGMARPAKLKRLTGMSHGKRFQAQDAVMDEETRKQMEALGYL